MNFQVIELYNLTFFSVKRHRTIYFPKLEMRKLFGQLSWTLMPQNKQVTHSLTNLWGRQKWIKTIQIMEGNSQTVSFILYFKNLILNPFQFILQLKLKFYKVKKIPILFLWANLKHPFFKF
jgi:hypothetical protein